jgi:hypothetical protein
LRERSREGLLKLLLEDEMNVGMRKCLLYAWGGFPQVHSTIQKCWIHDARDGGGASRK